MGDYNPNTPTARGMETRYGLGYAVPDLSPLASAQLRFRPGATTIAAVHLCLLATSGAPGLHLAMIDEQQPAVTVTDFYPGSDTSAVTTGFEDQAAAAVNFGDVNDPNDATDYATFSAARGVNDNAVLQFRGNNAGELAGRRILRVQLQALIMNRRIIGTGLSGNALQLPVQGEIVVNGTTHRGNNKGVPKIDAYQLIPDLADWYLSPATGIPWTVAEVDDLIDAADADTFGLRLWGKADDAGARVSAYWLRVYHCAENRRGFLDQRGALRLGWDRYALGSTVALSADTYYWLELGSLTANQANNFTVGALLPLALPATDPTDNSSEHRQASGVLLTGPGGAAQEGTDKIGTSQVHGGGVLLEGPASAILAQSQPYAAIVPEFIGNFLGVDLRAGQQITTDSSQPVGGYSGVKLAVGWWDKTQRPNRPLTIEVQHGAGAITGAGTVDARATLIPEATPDGEIRDVFVRFDGGAVVLSNATQYHVHVYSDAIATNGANAWRIPKADSRSDLVLTGSGTSVANVQGATQGGTTDSYFTLGAADDRYDLPIALVAPPQPPASVTVTEFPAEPVAATDCVSTLPPRLRVTWPATNLGAGFGGYYLWVRRRSLPIEQPVLAAIVGDTVQLDDPSLAEDLHLEHWLSELGWTVVGAGYADGWDVGISVVDVLTGEHSAIRWTGVGNTTEPTSASWVTSDAARWLSTPLFAQRDTQSSPLTEATVFPEAAGRDGSIIRVSGNAPGRKYRLKWESALEFPDESILRGARAAYVAGRKMALLRCRGDLARGAFTTEPSTQDTDLSLEATADFVTTDPDPAVAGPNMPGGYVLDGGSQYITHPDDPLLNPGAEPFTLAWSGIPAQTTSWLLAKLDAYGNTGYAIYTTAAGDLRVYVKGSGAAVDQGVLLPDLFDGMYHVVIAVLDPVGGTLTLYLDGESVFEVALNAYAAVTNALAFTACSLAGGVNPNAAHPVNSYGVWLDAFTDDEALASSRYLLIHAGYRMTPGASLFTDLRDKEALGRDGKVIDQAGNALDGTVVGSPPYRGVPWPLRDLERKR